MAKAHKKSPKRDLSLQITPTKKPKGEPTSSDKDFVQWCFAIFDNKHWHDNSHTGESFYAVAKHLRDYQGLRWADVKRRDHPIEKNKIITEAQQRLEYLNQEDIDQLWRLQFTGLQRLWGIRDESVFRVLWWDPQHKICPSRLKHT